MIAMIREKTTQQFMATRIISYVEHDADEY